MTSTEQNLRGSISPRRLTAVYATALMIVGCLAVLSHMAQQRTLHGSEGLAAVINLSGRQRMLSQRVAGLAAEYRLGDPTAAGDLEKAASELEAAHLQLSNADFLRQYGAVTSRQIADIYYSGPNPLDKELRHFVATARVVGSLPADDPAQPALLAELNTEARMPLLASLNQVVIIYQRAAEASLTTLNRLQWFLLVLMVLTLLVEAQLVFRPMVRKIVEYARLLVHVNNIDPLTGVNNRRGFEQRSSVEFRRCLRYGQPVSVLVLDADHFKRINDTFGHNAGDDVLRKIGATLLEVLRDSDIVGRLGGEEFAVAMPETGLADAAVLAERLRFAIQQLQIIHEEQPIAVTVSIGVARLPSGATGIDDALNAADKLLYQAKQSGRNRVVAETWAGADLIHETA